MSVPEVARTISGPGRSWGRLLAALRMTLRRNLRTRVRSSAVGGFAVGRASARRWMPQGSEMVATARPATSHVSSVEPPPMSMSTVGTSGKGMARLTAR